MRFRLIFTLPLTLLATFLHLGCCLLPLLSIAGTSLPFFDLFARYKTTLTVFQLLVTMYLLGKIILDQTHIKPFCDARERVIHWIGVAIAVVGLTINYYEPFKSEDQQLAEQQFLRFKSHRQMDIAISGDYDHEKLLNDLAEIKGVKSNPHSNFGWYGRPYFSKQQDVPVGNSRKSQIKGLRSVGLIILMQQ